MALLDDAEGGVLDLNKAAEALHVQARPQPLPTRGLQCGAWRGSRAGCGPGHAAAVWPAARQAVARSALTCFSPSCARARPTGLRCFALTMLCRAACLVQKRRIYDITNVLEGIGVIGKCGKNNVRFTAGGVAGPGGSAMAAAALGAWQCEPRGIGGRAASAPPGGGLYRGGRRCTWHCTWLLCPTRTSFRPRCGCQR